MQSVQDEKLCCSYPTGTVTLRQRCHNVVVELSQRFDTVGNESCADVGVRRCDKVVLRRFQDVATPLLQRRENINHWISRPFYYKLF